MNIDLWQGIAMARNTVQFQKGLSEAAFEERYGTILLQGSPDRVVRGRLERGRALVRGGPPCRSKPTLTADTTFRPSGTE
jgi:hypothetical protein